MGGDEVTSSVQLDEPKAAPRTGRVPRRRVADVALWTLLIAVLVFFVLRPLVPVVTDLGRDGFSAVSRALDRPHIGQTLRNTLVLAAGASAFAVVAGILLAWCASVLPPRWRPAAAALAIVPLVMPALSAVIGARYLFDPRVGYVNKFLRHFIFTDLTTGPIDVYSMPLIIVVSGTFLTPFMFLFVYDGFRALGSQFEMAASASGSTPWRTLFTITLPMLRPAILYGGGIVVLLGLGQFNAPLLLGRRHGIDVLSTELYRNSQGLPIDRGVGAALGIPLLLAGALVIFAQKRGLRRQHRFHTTGAKGADGSATAKRWPAAIILLYLTITTLLPLLALGHVALSPFFTGDLDQSLTLRHVREVVLDDRVLSAVRTSTSAAALAILVVLPVGFVVALTSLRWFRVPRWVMVVAPMIALVPLAVPHSLFGYGSLIAYTTAPTVLYGTQGVLVVVYATIMLPYAVQFISSGLATIGSTSWEAAQSSGAGPMRNLLRIIMPQVKRSIAAGAAVMFVMLVGEFSVSVFVRSVRTQVMGTLLYDFWDTGATSQVAVLALLIVAGTFIGVVVALAFGDRRR